MSLTRSLTSGQLLTLLPKILPLITTFALYTDIISVPLLSLFLQLQFRRWQNQGLFKDQRITLRRIGKQYYELNVRLTLESSRTEKFLVNLITETSETLVQELRSMERRE